jgi:hypothetical protein
MSSSGPRPVRNLAAWGYESDGSGGTGDRLEVDVWTVNAVESPEPLPDPEDVAGSVEAVLALAGNVVKVEYAGAAGVGYQYLDPSAANDPNAGPFDATQNAFAGAARAAGGERTGSGTFGPGAEPAVVGPDLDAVVREGRREVLPAVEQEFPELGRRLKRERDRDEDEEQVAAEPFDGFRNEVRALLSTGDAYYYEVRNGRLVRTDVRRSR